jgi:hypothetical protein
MDNAISRGIATEMMKNGKTAVGSVIVAAIVAATMVACSQLEPRDKRFY